RWFLAALASLGLATQAFAQEPMPIAMSPSAALPMQPVGPMPPMPPMRPMPPMGPMGSVTPAAAMGMPPQGPPLGDPTFGAPPCMAPAPPFAPAPPMGGCPDACCTLPNDGSPNGFNDECKSCSGTSGFLVSIGFIALQRQSVQPRPVAFLETTNVGDTGIVQP